VEPIDRLFDRLDEWRLLPNYQLERRADIFFSLYLAEALEDRLGVPLCPELAPEFPVRIGAIAPGSESHKSKKIDYLAVTAAGDQAVFVELKTDAASRNAPQDEYLRAARDVGLAGLLEGLLAILCKTDATRKYCQLLCTLERMGLLALPDRFHDIMKRPRLNGIVAACDSIVITAPAAPPRIVYVQPTGDRPYAIGFGELAGLVERHADPVSQRFAASLRAWASSPASVVRAVDPEVKP